MPSDTMKQYEYEKEQKEKMKASKQEPGAVGKIILAPISDFSKILIFGLVVAATFIIYSGAVDKDAFSTYYGILVKLNIFTSFGNAYFLYGRPFDGYVAASVFALVMYFFALPLL